MTLALRNNNKAMRNIAAAGATALATYAGPIVLSGTGKQLFWNGVQYVGKRAMEKWKARGRNTVTHPGALPGSVAAPVAITRIVRGSKPKFKRGVGSVTVSHRELVGTFNVHSDLVVNAGVPGNLYRLNPTNGSLFSWLQMLASNFDQYRFESVKLQYVPLCTTTTSGRVALYYDKDSQDPEPTDRVELANMAHITETSPWAEATLTIPTDGIKRFTNDANAPSPKLLDLGQVGFATYGGVGSTVAGDVFIHYTTTFFEPQPSSGLVSTLKLVGTTTTTAGPVNVSIARNTTNFAVSFKSPGTYFGSYILKATSIVSNDPTTGAAYNTDESHADGTQIYAMFNITISVPGAGFVVTGTAFGDFVFNSVRANKANLASV